MLLNWRANRQGSLEALLPTMFLVTLMLFIVVYPKKH